MYMYMHAHIHTYIHTVTALLCFQVKMGMDYVQLWPQLHRSSPQCLSSV